MAVNVGRGLEIPEPSDYSSSEDDDVTYFTDLQQPDNNLPESGRVINKLLNNLVDNAWELISEQDKIKRDEQAARQIPVLSATEEMKVCLTCTIIWPRHIHVLCMHLSKMFNLHIINFFRLMVLSFQAELIALCALRMDFICFWVTLMVCQSSVHPLSPV